MTDIAFPRVSEKDPDAEGVVSTWFVVDGQQVGEGDLLAEVAVDKVDLEVTSPGPGVIRLLVGEGAVVAQGAAIARIAS